MPVGVDRVGHDRVSVPLGHHKRTAVGAEANLRGARVRHRKPPLRSGYRLKSPLDDPVPADRWLGGIEDIDKSVVLRGALGRRPHRRLLDELKSAVALDGEDADLVARRVHDEQVPAVPREDD
ncbi:MAG: hypothetical protein M3252_01420 [Actinomycetota bacterium]|nr:hypothetical protein [Actinomycetota bacterium]